MSDFDDAIGEMVDDLHDEAGASFNFRDTGSPGAVTAVTARMSTLPSYQVDNGNGSLIEVRPVDFIVKTSDLPFGNPVKGQRIETGTTIYEIWSVNNEKCFRQISPQMTRIHTKRIQ